MPQMSPMNWILISMNFTFIYFLMKFYNNSNFKSKINKKEQLNFKKMNLLW